MAKPISIVVPLQTSDRVAVRLLRSVKSVDGQEFVSGWIAGFSSESSAELVRLGWAVYLDQAKSNPPQPAPNELAEEQRVVTSAPISSGGDAEEVAAQEHDKPQPHQARRRRI